MSLGYFGKQIEFESPVKMDLKINIKNFGPITKGTINLKPLTIFIGPNNSGKSYAAMLIHSILSAENQINNIYEAFFRDPDFRNRYYSYEKNLQKIIDSNKGKQKFVIPTGITKKIYSFIVQTLSENLERSISRNFGSPVSDLVRTKQRAAKITISDSDISDSIRFNITIDKKFNAKYHSNHPKYTIKILKENRPNSIKKEDPHSNVIHVHEDFVDESLKYHILHGMNNSIIKNIIHSNIPTNSFYFPAARSGILQGHRALSASIIRSAPLGGIESFQIPKLTGVTSDFISNITLMPNIPGSFFELAEQLESELLHGSIKLPSPVKETIPEITYKSKHNEIPLHRTSSTISEIAPFSLYLKYIVRFGNLLIIEEPEAHLHPSNQLIFAKYIVKMIRSGLNVLVTTHSVFLLESLGKFMLASKIKPDIRRKKLKLGDDYLCPEEVSPYVFVRNDDDDHIILPIETNDEEGISQEEFVKINEHLHTESIRLQRYLSEK